MTRPPTNDDITAATIRLVDREGEQVGVLPIERAREIASDRSLELVEVESQADPPVCRLMTEDEIARRFDEEDDPRPTVLREIRLGSPDQLAQSDLDEARAHLERGDALKVTLRDVGRDDASRRAASRALDSFVEQLADIARVDVEPQRAGRDMVIFFAPE